LDQKLKKGGMVSIRLSLNFKYLFY